MTQLFTDLHFGYGQVQTNIAPYAIEDSCLDGSAPTCVISDYVPRVKLSLLRYGEYLSFSPSSDATYPYTAKIFSKTNVLVTTKGNVKLENMNDDFAIVSNATGDHLLLSLKKLLPPNHQFDSNSFQGVSQAELTTEYINSKAAGGSTTPLIKDTYLQTKFSPIQAASTDYDKVCVIQSKCIINTMNIGTFSNTSNIIHGTAKVSLLMDPSDIFGNTTYLKFSTATQLMGGQNKYALKLYDTAGTVLATVSNGGTFANVNQDFALFIDNTTKKGILLDFNSTRPFRDVYTNTAPDVGKIFNPCFGVKIDHMGCGGYNDGDNNIGYNNISSDIVAFYGTQTPDSDYLDMVFLQTYITN